MTDILMDCFNGDAIRVIKNPGDTMVTLEVYGFGSNAGVSETVEIKLRKYDVNCLINILTPLKGVINGR